LQEYYLTNAEIDVLEHSADSIAKVIPFGAIVVELGSGFVTVSEHGRNLRTDKQPVIFGR
jgi:uncharacterized SAM-dependent methyltransferase